MEKELIEQDALSNAFESIIKSQNHNNLSKLKGQNTGCVKPTTLYLDIKQTKNLQHSTSCDTLVNCHLDQSKEQSSVVKNKEPTDTEFYIYKKLMNCGTVPEKATDVNFSPDSLITDDPSSSSDYLSAAYTCSPGASSSGIFVQLNVDNTIKVENIVTLSDSGLLESFISHKDITMADLSLTESTLQDLVTDETTNDSMSSPLDKNEENMIQDPTLQTTSLNTSSGENELNNPKLHPTRFKANASGKSSKEEKQRQNEEIVILESSSLSSETGSWESVFPPKLTEKDICEKFINHERQHRIEREEVGGSATCNAHDTQEYSSLVQKSPYKSTSCFIDAATLVDDNEAINIHIDTDDVTNVKLELISTPSMPMPCSSNKLDLSPNDWSDSNDNEDSLENKDMQKDVSPTIFEMTPVTEDSLCTNAFQVEAQITGEIYNDIFSAKTVYPNTPHNSLKAYKCESENTNKESDLTHHIHDSNLNIKKLKKCSETIPILSGGASIEDHLPQVSTYSPMSRRKIENTPIVSGAYTQEPKESGPSKSPKPSSAETWIVDMSEKVTDSSEKMQKQEKNINVPNPEKKKENFGEDEKSYHKFYIDLGTLSSSTPKKNNESVTEKKNIFSMFIDFGENTSVKEIPPKLGASLHMKKSNVVESKAVKENKCVKPSERVTLTDSHDNDIKENTFENYEALCNDPNISISEIIAIPKKTLQVVAKNRTVTTTAAGDTFVTIPNGITSGNKTLPAERTFEEKVKDSEPRKSNVSKNLKSPNNTQVTSSQPKQQQTQDHTDQDAALTSDLFVKLSDLDKPLNRKDLLEKRSENSLDARMTRSIPENNWGGQNHGAAPISSDVISSFHSENALSLNRLFPHLQNEFSRSMPGSLSSRTRSPLRARNPPSVGDADDQASDISEMSSIHSSACRSAVGK